MIGANVIVYLGLYLTRELVKEGFTRRTSIVKYVSSNAYSPSSNILETDRGTWREREKRNNNVCPFFHPIDHRSTKKPVKGMCFGFRGAPNLETLSRLAQPHNDYDNRNITKEKPDVQIFARDSLCVSCQHSLQPGHSVASR